MALTSCRKTLGTAWIASALLNYPLVAGASTISFEADGGGRTVVSATGGMFWHSSDAAVIFGPFANFALWTPAGTAVQNADGSWDFSFPSGILALSDVEGGASSFTYPVSASDIGVVPSLVGVIPVLPFSFSLTPPHDDSTWDLWSPPRPVASLVVPIELILGPGTLRSDFAALLGVHRETLGGKGTWVLDDWLHNPTASDCKFDDALSADESLHCAINNNAGVDLTVRDVPEPISIGLIGVVIAAFAARRRATKSQAA